MSKTNEAFVYNFPQSISKIKFQRPQGKVASEDSVSAGITGVHASPKAFKFHFENNTGPKKAKGLRGDAALHTSVLLTPSHDLTHSQGSNIQAPLLL